MSMHIRYRITLTYDEQQQLQALVSGGQGAVRKIKRAQILLAADATSTDEMIALNVGVGTSTVYRTKQRFVEEGLDRALREVPRPGAPRKLGASDEALLVAVACSHPPSGRARWTLDLLAREMVRLTSHEALSGDTVGRRLAEMALKPWQEKMWCIPTVNAEYVARMEDVLDLYAEPPDPRRPVVGFDETPRQLIGEARVPIRAKPGKPRRVDYEYVRNGTANVFMFVDVNRPGDMPRSPTNARASTSQSACAISSMSTTRRPNGSVWCSTIFRHIQRQRSTTPSIPPRHDGFSVGSSFTSRRNTPAGSTWSRSKSA